MGRRTSRSERHSNGRPRRARLNPPALVVGGSANAVSVARSLGRANVAVHALSSQLEPVRYSRYCASWTQLGTDRVQERWLAWPRSAGPRGAVLLPCNEEARELVARRPGEPVACG